MKVVTRDSLKVLRAEINAALKSVAEKHNISIEAGNASFTSNNATFKLVIATKGDNGSVLTPEAEALKQYKDILGLNFGLNDTFVSRGEKYKVTGLKPRSTKYPILAENVNTGQTYKFPVSTVNFAIAKG